MNSKEMRDSLDASREEVEFLHDRLKNTEEVFFWLEGR